MIWGLEEEDDHTTRTKQDSPSRATTHRTPRKMNARPGPHLPPRFHRSEELQAQRPAMQQPVKLSTPYLVSSERQQPDVHRPSSHADIDLSLPGHGPIDLSNVLRPRVNVSDSYLRHSEMQNEVDRLQDSLLYGYDDASWQNPPSVNEHLKAHVLPLSSSVMTELNNYLTPPLSSSSSLQSLSSSHSPVALESLNRLPHSISAQGAPRRMSALEIAQNYRQQQIQQKGFLPTPPNSSSPLWASRFSPYQGSLVSPDLLASSTLPPVSGKYTIPQNYQLPAVRQKNILSLLPHVTSPVIDLNALRPQLEVASLAPSAHIQDPVFRVQDLSVPAYMQDTTIPDGPRLRAQRQFAHHLISSPVTTATRSPAPPRPPPNTPSAVMPSPRTVQSYDVRRTRMATVVDAPPSPTSPPNHRTRSVSHQQQRAIPLTQVLSRRLPVVPEEDAGAYGNPRSPSPAGYHSSSRTRSVSSGQAIHQPRQDYTMLLADNRVHSALRTPSPGHDYLRDSAIQDSRYADYVNVGALGVQPPYKQSRNRALEMPAHPTAYGGRSVVRGQEEVSNDSSSRGNRGGRGNRGRGGGRGKRGHARTPSTTTRNGPERVDGGMTVRC